MLSRIPSGWYGGREASGLKALEWFERRNETHGTNEPTNNLTNKTQASVDKKKSTGESEKRSSRRHRFVLGRPPSDRLMTGRRCLVVRIALRPPYRPWSASSRQSTLVGLNMQQPMYTHGTRATMLCCCILQYIPGSVRVAGTSYDSLCDGKCKYHGTEESKCRKPTAVVRRVPWVRRPVVIRRRITQPRASFASLSNQ